MKKILQTCFLALLCLAGSSSSAQSRVADSPPEKPLYPSALPAGNPDSGIPVSVIEAGLHVSPHSGDTHRGGEILSDTFLKEETASLRASARTCPDYFGSDVSDHPTSSIVHPTPVIPHPAPSIPHPTTKGFSLVDNSTSPGQEESTPSAQAGEGTALIYGELINPDSLAPLLLVTTPYYLDPNSSYLRSEQEIVPQPGEFFDGVLNPMVQKFSAELPLSGRPGYFDLYLQERPLLHNYLIYPGDSIKLSLDLMRMQVLFAGTNAAFYEAQHALKRQQKKVEFDAPRQLVTPKTSRMLQREESQAKIEKFKDGFGARLLILDPGKESLDYLLQGLENPSTLNAQLEVLDGFAEKLSPEQYSLLRTETICGFYSSDLASYRKFHHPYVESLAEEQRTGYRTRVRNLIQTVSGHDFRLDDQLVSAGFLNLGLEISILDAIWKEKSFLASVDEAFSGEVADRIRAGYLSNYLSALPEQENYINKFLKQTTTAPWRERILSLERSHIPGDTILPVTLYDMEGETYGREDLAGRPTLLYFYFSTCSHSASFFKNYLFPLYRETEALGYRLIAISVDRDPSLWRSRIESYSDPAILNLNLRGEDKERWRSYYEMYAYPQTMFLDASGRIVSFDIRDLGKNYESLEKGFVKLYREKITNQTPFSEPYL